MQLLESANCAFAYYMHSLRILVCWVRCHTVSVQFYLFPHTMDLLACYKPLLVLVEEPNLKKCVIKGDNWNIKGPTKNPYIFIA